MNGTVFFANRVRFRIQQAVQGLFHSLTNNPVQVFLDLFFIHFDRSGNGFFPFLHYILHSLFPFLTGSLVW